MFLNEKHILKELRQMIKVIKDKFNICNLKKYSHKKVDLDQFQYIEKVLKKKTEFNLKN